MQTDEFDAFRKLLELLCAGFGVPYTKAREGAYWASLARMSIAVFRRCVEHALGPDYVGDTFPTAGQIWRIYKGAAMPEGARDAKGLPGIPDHLTYLANRFLWLHLSHRGGLGSSGRFVAGEAKISGMVDCEVSPELKACLEFNREIVAEFCDYIREGDEMATPAVFIRCWLIGLGKVSTVLARTTATLYELAERIESQTPFDASMAREMAEPTPELA